MAVHRSPKSKAAGLIPSVPAIPGVDISRIAHLNDIPDEYIRTNYVLNDYRTKDKVILDYIPLFDTIVDHIIKEYGLSTGRLEEGVELDPHAIKNIVAQLFPSDEGLALFKKIKIYRTPSYFSVQVSRRKTNAISASEIILCREETQHESDTSVITKLKKMVYIDILEARKLATKASRKKKSTIKRKKALK